MREPLTRDKLYGVLRELARSARSPRRVYLLGGATAVELEWRSTTIDVDLSADHDDVFRDVQDIKERLNVNIEFARPEDFVPPLRGSSRRHVHFETIGRVSFYHYDPYAQTLSKVVRGFERDIEDANDFVRSGLVEPGKLRTLVASIRSSTYAKYPALSKQDVEKAVEAFLTDPSR